MTQSQNHRGKKSLLIACTHVNRAPALDPNTRHRSKLIGHLLRYMNLTSFSCGFHTRSYINCVSPNVVLWLVAAYDSRYHGPKSNSHPQLEILKGVFVDWCYNFIQFHGKVDHDDRIDCAVIYTSTILKSWLEHVMLHVNLRLMICVLVEGLRQPCTCFRSFWSFLFFEMPYLRLLCRNRTKFH